MSRRMMAWAAVLLFALWAILRITDGDVDSSGTVVTPTPTATAAAAPSPTPAPTSTRATATTRSPETTTASATTSTPTPSPTAAQAAASAPTSEAPATTEAEEVDPELGRLYEVVRVVDGDTLTVTVDGVRERVRIIGIDAPEFARGGSATECYAQEATDRLEGLIGSGGSVHLLPDPTQADRDRYDRLLRHVVLDGGGHVALSLVEGGYAVERQYAAPYQYQADLLAAQSVAQVEGRGMWAACALAAQPDPVAPGPAAAATAAPAPPAAAPVAPAPGGQGCVIKGNISSSGERIYHVPGQRHYDETVISPEKGERWFCTEQEAVDAGWRKAKV